MSGLARDIAGANLARLARPGKACAWRRDASAPAAARALCLVAILAAGLATRAFRSYQRSV